MKKLFLCWLLIVFFICTVLSGCVFVPTTFSLDMPYKPSNTPVFSPTEQKPLKTNPINYFFQNNSLVFNQNIQDFGFNLPDGAEIYITLLWYNDILKDEEPQKEIILQSVTGGAISLNWILPDNIPYQAISVVVSESDDYRQVLLNAYYPDLEKALNNHIDRLLYKCDYLIQDLALGSIFEIVLSNDYNAMDNNLKTPYLFKVDQFARQYLYSAEFHNPMPPIVICDIKGKPLMHDRSLKIPQATSQSASQEDEIVYATNNGKRFHKFDCSYAKYAKEITYRQAVESKRDPCLICYKK